MWKVILPNIGFTLDPTEPSIWKKTLKFMAANLMIRTLILWPVASYWYYTTVYKKLKKA